MSEQRWVRNISDSNSGYYGYDPMAYKAGRFDDRFREDMELRRAQLQEQQAKGKDSLIRAAFEKELYKESLLPDALYLEVDKDSAKDKRFVPIKMPLQGAGISGKQDMLGTEEPSATFYTNKYAIKQDIAKEINRRQKELRDAMQQQYLQQAENTYRNLKAKPVPKPPVTPLKHKRKFNFED